MDYQFKHLLSQQAELDKQIISKKNLPEEDRLLKKVVAFNTELAEFVNELPEYFKFWSNKSNDYKKAIVEYVDGLHFILSMANDIGFKNLTLTPYEIAVYSKKHFINQMIYLYFVSSRLASMRKPIYIEMLLAAYIGLGNLVGFKWDDVVQAYLDKNKVNHERQENNY